MFLEAFLPKTLREEIRVARREIIHKKTGLSLTIKAKHRPSCEVRLCDNKDNNPLAGPFSLHNFEEIRSSKKTETLRHFINERAQKVGENPALVLNIFILAIDLCFEQFRDRSPKASHTSTTASGESEPTTVDNSTPSGTVIDPQNPGLLSIIRQKYQKRVVGEEHNVLSLFQYLVGALNGRRAIVAIKGGSGGGKSSLCKAILAPFDKLGFVLEFSRITGTYLEHLGLRQIKAEKEEGEEDIKRDTYEVTVPQPILYIQEAKGVDAALQSIKLFYSEGKIILGITIDNKPVTIIVKGIQVVLTTTTSPAFEDFEFENRVSPLHIDESDELTGRIKQHQGEASEGFEQEEDDENPWLLSPEVQQIAEFVKRLKPVHVSLPFGKELADVLPNKPLWIRREHPKLQRIVKNLATIHQYQRSKGRDSKTALFGIYADPVDLQYALQIGLASMKETLTGKTEIEDKILGIVKETPPVIGVRRGRLGEEPVTAWTTKSILKQLGLGLRRESWLRKIINGMVAAGYLDEDDREKPFKLSSTGLEPETVEVNLKGGEDLTTWALRRGHEITELKQPAKFLDPFDESKSPSPNPSDSSASDRSEPISSSHREGQDETAQSTKSDNIPGRFGVPDMHIGNGTGGSNGIGHPCPWGCGNSFVSEDQALFGHFCPKHPRQES